MLVNESNSKAVAKNEMVTVYVDESDKKTVGINKMVSRNVNESNGKALVNGMKVMTAQVDGGIVKK